MKKVAPYRAHCSYITIHLGRSCLGKRQSRAALGYGEYWAFSPLCLTFDTPLWKSLGSFRYAPVTVGSALYLILTFFFILKMYEKII